MIDLSPSDWINIATATGVGVTAAFTGLGWYWVRRQALTYGPALNVYIARPDMTELPLLRLSLIPSDRERFMISELAIRPRGARIVLAAEARDELGGVYPCPSETRMRSFEPDSGCTSLEVFIDCGEAAAATIRVHISSKADSKVRSRRKVKISKKD
jgi:hypothetical protein